MNYIEYIHWILLCQFNYTTLISVHKIIHQGFTKNYYFKLFMLCFFLLYPLCQKFLTFWSFFFFFWEAYWIWKNRSNIYSLQKWFQSDPFRLSLCWQKYNILVSFVALSYYNFIYSKDWDTVERMKCLFGYTF